MGRWLVGLALIVAAGVGACRYVMPDGYAVNVPLRSVVGGGIDAPEASVLDDRVEVPQGFRIDLYAEGIRGARFLRFSDAGDLLVSQPGAGAVMLVARDADGDGRSDGQRVVIDALKRPHGLDLRDGWLYVAETGAVGRIRFDAATGQTTGSFERFIDDLPAGGQHSSRTARFGPDGWLYVSVGSSCNVCEEEHPYRAAIVRYRADGSDAQVYATGLRNAVGFDWQPETGELYATDNGRDLLGDDFPPCELNRVTESGFYGWPYAHGDNVPDPDFGEDNAEKIATAIAPAHPFPAHNAPLGIAFVRNPDAPPGLRGAALVALHGSWNRSEKDGYKVVSLHWGADGRIEERDFAVGFLQDGDVIGRPVDVAEGPDGALYISDDYAGSIYRVSWTGS